MTGLSVFIKSVHKELVKKKRKLLAVASLASMVGLIVSFPLITGLDNLKESAPLMVLGYLVLMFLFAAAIFLVKYLDIGDILLDHYEKLDRWILLVLLISPIVVFLMLLVAKAVKFGLISLPWQEKTKNP